MVEMIHSQEIEEGMGVGLLRRLLRWLSPRGSAQWESCEIQNSYPAPDAEQVVFTSGEGAKAKYCPMLLNKLRLQGRISSDDETRLCMAFSEAFANAVEHGNLELDSSLRSEVSNDGKDRYSAEKERRLEMVEFRERLVTVTSIIQDDQLEIAIIDQGPGFNPAEFLSGTKSILPSEEVHGRGLLLIKAIFDEVKFSNGGREIRLIKRIG